MRQHLPRAWGQIPSGAAIVSKEYGKLSMGSLRGRGASGRPGPQSIPVSFPAAGEYILSTLSGCTGHSRPKISATFQDVVLGALSAASVGIDVCDARGRPPCGSLAVCAMRRKRRRDGQGGVRQVEQHGAAAIARYKPAGTTLTYP